MIRLKRLRTGLLAAAFLLVCSGAFAAIPIATNAWNVAFYPLTDRTVGETFTSSKPTDGTHMEATAKFSKPVAFRPDFAAENRQLGCRAYGDGSCRISDDVPGRYLYATAASRVPMAGPGDYLSLQSMPTNAYWGKGNPSVFLNGFGNEFGKGGRTEWTFEYFVKGVSLASGENILFFDINKYVGADGNEHSGRVGLSWAKEVSLYCTDTYLGSSWKTNNSKVTLSENPATDGRWHHVALVCAQETDAATGTTRGTLTLFVDYQKGVSSEADGDGKMRFELPYNAGLELRIQAGTGEVFLAAPRFSDKALGAADFMRVSDEPTRVEMAETVAFYPLDDQPVGIVFESVGTEFQAARDLYTNQVASAYAVNGRKVGILGANRAEGDPRTVAEARADVPATFIYPNLSATVPLREPKTALLCYEASDETGLKTSTLQIDYLTTTLNSELETWTLEWFEKPLIGRSYMYADFYNNGKDAEYSRIVIDSYSADSKRPNAYAYFATQGAKTGATNIVFEGETELADGKWHHRAIVLSKVDGEDRISLYCDYVRLGGPLPVHRDPNGTINHICRFGQGVGRALYSSIRLSKGALAPQDFMYASNRAGGVLGDGSWLWALDGARGEAVASAEASRVTLPADNGQWLFAQPARGLSASVAGEGAATYAEPVFRGRRLLDGADGGRNKASASLAGAFVAPSLGAPLARLGLAFTVEMGVSATPPSDGTATVLGAETADGDTAWRVAVDSTGALVLSVGLEDGNVVTRTVADGWTEGTPRQVAVSCDVLQRCLKVCVDRVLVQTLTADDLPVPLALGENLCVGGGCGGAALSGRVDEIRVSRGVLLEPKDMESFEQRGFGLVIR